MTYHQRQLFSSKNILNLLILYNAKFKSGKLLNENNRKIIENSDKLKPELLKKIDEKLFNHFGTHEGILVTNSPL